MTRAPCIYSGGIRETVFLTLFSILMCYIGSGHRLPPKKSASKGLFPGYPLNRHDTRKKVCKKVFSFY